MCANRVASAMRFTERAAMVVRIVGEEAAIAFGSLCRHPDSRALIHPSVLIGPCVTGVETAESRKSSRR